MQGLKEIWRIVKPNWWISLGIIIAWTLVSLCAVYPRQIIELDGSLFSLSTTKDLLLDFLIPFLLFLCAFILDFLISIKSVDAFPSLIWVKCVLTLVLLLFVNMILFYTSLLWDFCPVVKLVLFLLIWLDISGIKAVSFMTGLKQPVELIKI